MRGLGTNQDRTTKNRNLCLQAIRTGDFDLFHPTYYDPYFLSDLKDKPFVLTVYDLIHERLSGEFPDLQQDVAEQKILLMEKSEKIIAISKNTKRDLVEIYGIPEEKVAVIYLGCSQLIGTKPPKDKLTAPNRYILFVGHRASYKNFDKLLNAVAPLLESDPELFLVCAGGKPLKPVETKKMVKLGIRGQVLQYQVKDQGLAELYRRALFFVFPSRYEGFGLPILEAFSSRCPVVLSNTSSMPEIAGEAALYFDPESEGSMSEALRRLIEDEPLRKELQSLGEKKGRNFHLGEDLLFDQRPIQNCGREVII